MTSAPATPALRVPGLIAWPLILAGLGTILWMTYQYGAAHAPRSAFASVSAAPRIEDVRALARLAVLRIRVADVIEGTTRGGRAAVIVKGDGDISVDMDSIAIEAVDTAARTATLRLPRPRPDRPRVDHDATRIFELRKTGLASLNPFADPRVDLLHDAMRAAQAQISALLDDPDLVSRAQQQAEAVLTAFYGQLGWNVTIEWRP
ncbi:MAG: DUF4230 domain-containing protein [Phycisphaerales bacterium]|nr:DUF4230 domain-containing protein [Phycisphaerales bacterium]